jgi:hypothetical protein
MTPLEILALQHLDTISESGEVSKDTALAIRQVFTLVITLKNENEQLWKTNSEQLDQISRMNIKREIQNASGSSFNKGRRDDSRENGPAGKKIRALQSKKRVSSKAGRRSRKAS